MSDFKINGTDIPLGSNEHLKLRVGHIPSGTRIYLNVYVFRSKKPGPTMLVMGGVHGDEINGVEIVRRSIHNKMFDNLKCGSVIAIPLLNIYGFINFSRDTPDGKDVNRSYPGSSSGSLSSRVARTLTKSILPLVDFGVDFHTGGSARYNYPQIRFSADHKASHDLAKTFNAPYTIESAPISKSLRKVALGLDIPMLVYEGGESLRFDGLSIDKGLEGIQKILTKKKMSTVKLPKIKSTYIKKKSWLRASSAGIFTWFKSSGQYVLAGEKLGVINDPDGFEKKYILAKKTGYIIGHNNAPVVSLGDALFHVGTV